MGFYLYKKNEDKVDSFLRGRGMDIKPRGTDYESMSVEDLMRTKETIEDLIAEKVIFAIPIVYPLSRTILILQPHNHRVLW